MLTLGETVWGNRNSVSAFPFLYKGFPCGLAGKESACNVGDLGSIPGLGRSPGEGKGYALQYFWPGEFHGLYSAKELMLLNCGVEEDT